MLDLVKSGYLLTLICLHLINRVLGTIYIVIDIDWSIIVILYYFFSD